MERFITQLDGNDPLEHEVILFLTKLRVQRRAAAFLRNALLNEYQRVGSKQDDGQIHFAKYGPKSVFQLAQELPDYDVMEYQQQYQPLVQEETAEDKKKRLIEEAYNRV